MRRLARKEKGRSDKLSRALKERDEALAFQAATKDILTAISRSTSDAKPVFEAIVRSVPRLFDTRYVAVFLLKGEELHLAAAKADVAFERRHAASFRRFQESFPQPIHWGGFTGKALRSGKVSQIGPIIGNPKASPQAVKIAKEFGYNTMLMAPLMRDGRAIGGIGTTRPGVKLFSARELALFKAFAAQAVIAIENARRFNETKEALERQTATAEILKVISASPTSTQPVFESIVNNCGVLFKDSRVALWQISEGWLLPRASTGYMPEPMALDRESAIGACVLEARTIHFADLRLGAEQHPRIKQLGLKHGYLSGVYAPLLRDGQAIGAISLLRRELGAFSDKEVALLGTFADQAVIAIENARLFNETKEALEQQTTTASVLRVIAGSPTDLKPVMTAVVERAARLLEADHALIGQSDGENIHWLAAYGCPVPDGARSITRELPSGRAILDLQTTQIDDIGQIERDSLLERSYGRFGVRTICATPLIREGRAVGVILLRRTQVRPFTEKQMSLLRTFADQAVIAIENARLFNETREALEQQTASSEILRVISSTPGDIQPVLEAIVQNALRLCGASFGGIWAFDGTLFRCMHAIFPPTSSPEFVDGLTTSPIRPGPETPLRRVAIDKAPVHTADLLNDPAFSPPPHYRREGMRAALAVPMLKDGAVIGALAFHRYEPKPFTEKQIALVQAFASQAVIAIENSRLFGELKSSNASLRDALEQQTATAGVLRVISGSPTDTRPVFDVIAKSAMRLFGGLNVAILLRREKEFVLAGYSGPGMEDLPEQVRAAPLDPKNNFPSRAILEGKVLNVTDWEGADVPEHERFVAKSLGIKSGLMVPLLRQGEGIGAIAVVRATEGPFIDKDIALLRSFADQAVIAIENVRLFNETKEALERQTAISEILRVISGSPADVKPVLDTVASHAARICHAQTVDIVLADGPSLRVVASVGDEGRVLGQVLPLDRRSVSGRSIVDRVPVHVANMQEAESEFPLGCELARKYGFRTILGVPLLREGRALGAIMVRRTEVRPIEDKHVALLKTFADQAAIAIENVRLFNETKEALERQTATAEILKVISASPSDVQPVFDAVAVNAARVCGVDDVAILRTEERDLRRVAHYGSVPVTPDTLVPVPPGSVNERVLSERRTLHVPDTAAPSFAREFPGSQFLAMGVRALLATPLVHDGAAVGVIHLRRSEPRPFTDKQIALLETFADQAVIAIENVRLFNETREALERQTATGEILASMSGSMTDTKPVFDAIVRNLLRLFGTGYAVVALRRGEVFELAGFKGEPGFERLQEVYPLPVDRNTIIGEVVIAGQVRKYTPVVGNPAMPRSTAELGQRFGFNSVMAAPMMWKGEAIGAILTARQQALPFDDKQVTLIQSFADQAVIAIENVRLFKELQARTEALTKSVNQLTALGEVGQAISSSLELETVLKTIVQRAVQLSGMDAGSIYEFEARNQRFHLRATQNVAEDILDVYRKSPIRLGEGAVGRAGATREPVMVEDLLDVSYRSRARDALIKSGARALLAVPLLGEEHVLGALVVSRKSPGPFSREVIDLLNTFATQSAVAIQNARLFREIAEKSVQLEEASRHKSQFLASMSHELRTPLNAILGFNEMILGQVYGEVPSDMKEPLEDIQKSGKHLLRLINNVLDLAKIEAGKMELSLADYSVHDTVESVRSTLRPLAEAKGLELVVSVPEDIPLAYGDGGRLTQCLMNLAGNSLKFTKEGKVEIAVQAENGCLRWRVSDTGIGIPADKIPTLFSEFKQTDATIASEYGGTGLGLSITKKFVEMHGGRIWVESELGKGSVFTLEIPLRVTAPA